jgi:hypothetical protein
MTDVDALLDRLVPAFEDETGDWADVARRARRSRPRKRRPLLLLVPAAAALAAAAVLAGGPWRGGPTALDRAAAAIAGPRSGGVLAEDVTVSVVTPTGKHLSRRLKVWLTARSFRVQLSPATGESAQEYGGRFGAGEGLGLSGGYLVPEVFRVPLGEPDLDPTAFIRKALAGGRAHVAGAARIAGRRVVEIDLSSRLFGETVATARYFVDASTYDPVRLVVSAAVPNAAPAVLPLSEVASFAYGGLESGGDYVYRYDFARFEHLPASDAKLASMKAEHPGAKTI